MLFSLLTGIIVILIVLILSSISCALQLFHICQCFFLSRLFTFSDHPVVNAFALSFETAREAAHSDGEKPEDGPLVSMICDSQVVISIVHHEDAIGQVCTDALVHLIGFLGYLIRLGHREFERRLDQADVVACRCVKRHDMQRDLNLVERIERLLNGEGHRIVFDEFF